MKGLLLALYDLDKGKIAIKFVLHTDGNAYNAPYMPKYIKYQSNYGRKVQIIAIQTIVQP